MKVLAIHYWSTNEEKTLCTINIHMYIKKNVQIVHTILFQPATKKSEWQVRKITTTNIYKNKNKNRH